MDRSVAARAEGYKILLRIVTQLAPVLDVMHFEVRQGAAPLASPAIPFEDSSH